MATFISQNTDEPLPIVCRFCANGTGERILEKPTRVAATRLRGQWEGGDLDENPVWVPICVEHDSRWDIDPDTDERTLDPRYQLPAFDLPTFWVVIEREQPAKDMAIGPYASDEDAELAMDQALLVEGELQEGGTDCFVTSITSYWEDVHPAYDVVLIDLDNPDYTGKNDPIVWADAPRGT